MRDKLLRWAILPALIAAGFGLGVLVATDQFRIADDSSLEPGSQAANGSSAVDFDPAEDRKAQHSTEPTSGLVNPFAGAAPSGLDNSSSSQQLGGVTRSSPSVADWDSEDLSLLDPADRGTATDNFAEHNDGESSLYEESLATSGADDDSYAEDVEEAEASLEDDLLATEDEPPPDVHTIAGRVLNQAGELLAGIGVTATLNQYHEDGTAMSVTVSPQRTVSDGLGHYAFQGLPDGMYTIATVRTVQHPVTRIWVRAGVDYADLVVATQNDLRLYGTVTDTAYVPMSSVSINAWAPDLIGTQTDGSGWFELFVPLDGSARSFPVRFTRTGYKIREFLLGEKDWQTGSQIALDVTLEPIGVPTDVTGTLRSAA
ncbi:MAG: carboxypeptidase-like regulatory domain-containing protein, partial [Gammaproteobacteria bacterium]|nr:carboxypeptidase-like regulatory domain-containing protein [Gammaproteobacteria bacterium]